MRSIPLLRDVRPHLPLGFGALLLTQLPALPLLLLGRTGQTAIGLYLLGSLVALLALTVFGLVYWNRVQRIVALVREYVEHGFLPATSLGWDGGSVARVKSSLASLDRTVRSLEEEAARDPLTGSLNRRACAARLEDDLALSRRSGVPFSIAVFDLDRLKSINDRHGHVAGDAALRHVVHSIQGGIRERDWIARWGGDEFLVGFWDTHGAAARIAAERTLAHLAYNPIPLDDLSLCVGSCVGVAEARPEDDPSHLFARADAALIEAKRRGPGRVQVG